MTTQRNRNPLLFWVALTIMHVAISAPAYAHSMLETVMLSHQPTGWTPPDEVLIGHASHPSLDQFGRVHFAADFAGRYGMPAGVGLWAYDRGELISVLRPDVTIDAYGQPTNFASMFGIGAPSADSAYFRGYVGESWPYKAGIWLANNGSATKIMLEGEIAPDNNSQWGGTAPGDIAVGGRLFFHATMRQPDDDPYEFRSTLWLADGGGPPEYVVGEGDSLPKLAAGQQVQYVSYFSFAEQGDTAFVAGYSGVDANNPIGHGMWMRTKDGELRLLAKSGDIIEVFGEQLQTQFLSYSWPLLNNHRQVLVRRSFESNAFSPKFVEGVWLQNADGSERLIAHTGLGPSPDQTIVFGRFDNIVNFNSYDFFLNDHGKVAFSGMHYDIDELVEVGASNLPSTVDYDRDDVGPILPSYRRAIWTEDQGVLKRIAQVGDILPGVDRPLVWAAPLGLNNAGQLLFRGSLTPDFFSPQETVLWAQDRSGTLQFIVKTGQQIDVAPGPEIDLRTVFRFDVPITSNGPGGPMAFNDWGQILLEITFTDGTRGMFLSNAVAVPEPSGVMLTVVLALLMFRRHRSDRMAVRQSVPAMPG